MRIGAILLALVISALFITSAVIQPWNEPGAITLTVKRGYGGSNESVLVNYSISSSRYSDPVRIVLVPLDRYEPLPIYIFSDKNKYSIQDYARILGLYDHIRAEIEISGLPVTVRLVDHQGALDVMKGGPSALIIVNSTQDWSDQEADMLSWVEKGGLIFGLGSEALPFVSANSSMAAPYQIGYEALDYEGGSGVTASLVATAFGFEFVSPRQGMRVSDVENYGQAIGYLYSRGESLTSAAVIHRGNGSIVLLSDAMDQPFTTSMEDAVAKDVVSMIASGLPWASGPLYWTQIEGTGDLAAGSFVATMSPSNLLSCYAFSTADHQHRNRLLIA